MRQTSASANGQPNAKRGGTQPRARTDSVREAAYAILNRSIGHGAYANIALQALDRPDFSRTDRAFATELVYGTLSRMRALDHVLGQFSSIPVRKMSPQVHVLLLLGAFQLLYLDRVPESAACNTTVEMAKNHCGKSVGFVNAVLRALVRGKDSLKWPDPAVNWVEAMGIRHSHPDWMVASWLEAFGPEQTERLLVAGNGHPPLTIRANRLKNSPVELMERLVAQGVQVHAGTVSPDALVLTAPDGLTRLEAFREGRFTVQDESAMLVAAVVDPQPGERVLDTCSAPGGKTTHLAERMGNLGEIVAWDLHPNKLGLIRTTADRLGIGIIGTRQHDATEPEPACFEAFDRVLVDAPCSGTGIIRRKPDIKWNRKPGDMAALVEIQNQILYNAGRCVKPGGVLVYSTCSMERAENEDVCSRFLSRCAAEGPAFAVDEQQPYRRLFPDNPETDGFFIARFTREK
jgi:16S rRNA (cytosine967-C5)-methyltransferase